MIPETYPNAYIIGAPKCGTTSIANWLTSHPQVISSKTKEPNYFYTPYGRCLSKNQYLDSFPAGSDNTHIKVEGSVWYLFSGVAIERILAIQPRARFIVCLRDPVEMLPSLHAQKVFSCHEALLDVEDAWAASKSRERGSFEGVINLPPTADPSHMAYAKACRLGEQVEKLLQMAPRESVKFVSLEEIKNDPWDTYVSICTFLGISADRSIELGPANPATRWRSHAIRTLIEKYAPAAKRSLGVRKKTGLLSWIHSINRKVEKYPELRPAFKTEVESYFATDKALLKELTGKDFLNG